MGSGKHLQNVKRRIFHVSRKLNPYVRLLVVCLVGKLSSRSVINYLKGREVTLPCSYRSIFKGLSLLFSIVFCRLRKLFLLYSLSSLLRSHHVLHLPFLLILPPSSNHTFLVPAPTSQPTPSPSPSSSSHLPLPFHQLLLPIFLLVSCQAQTRAMKVS